MKTFLLLAAKSLLHRRETVFLTVVSLALSIFLLLSVERLRKAAEDGFTQTISQTDLIVGARTGPVNLVLATVFNRGTFANNIKESTYEYWKKNDAIEWSFPLVLGDGHRGYRVVGTNEDFYRHYRYQGHESLILRQGTWIKGLSDVVVGSDIARALGYQMGQKVVIDHGVTHEVGMIHHDDHPFQVTGVLAPTGTIIDQSLFVTIESLEAMHGGGAHHDEEHSDEHEEGHEDTAHGELTAFFLKLKNRVDVLRLQREVNNYTAEPLSAVIPAVVINDIWHMMSYVESALRFLGICILSVSFLSMISMLISTLNERRREMSILRALGAGPRQLAGLLVLESTVITLVSLGVGLAIQFFVASLMGNYLKEHYGLFLGSLQLTLREWLYLGSIGLAGCLIGLVPAIRVYRNTLKDGLTVK